jgi:hypothetical protein
MLRIDRKNQGFTLLETPSLAEVPISERITFRSSSRTVPYAFFQELGLELFLVGKEISPQRREVRQGQERVKKLLEWSDLFWKIKGQVRTHALGPLTDRLPVVDFACDPSALAIRSVW